MGWANKFYHYIRLLGSTVSILLITSSLTYEMLLMSLGNRKGLFLMLFTRSTMFPALYGGLNK